QVCKERIHLLEEGHRPDDAVVDLEATLLLRAVLIAPVDYGAHHVDTLEVRHFPSTSCCASRIAPIPEPSQPEVPVAVTVADSRIPVLGWTQELPLPHGALIVDRDYGVIHVHGALVRGRGYVAVALRSYVA